jgi:hypothetical protein
MMVRTWKSLATALVPHPLGTRVRVARHLVEHPLDAGMQRSLAFPAGQRADYSLALDASRVLHVQDFGEHLEGYLHTRVPLVLNRQDATVDPVSGGMALGSILSMSMSRNKGAVFAGAILGALLGAALVNSKQGLSETVGGAGTKEGTGMSPALSEGTES